MTPDAAFENVVGFARTAESVMSMLHGSVTGDSTRVADDAGLTWIEDKATIDRLLASVLVLVEAENVAHPADEERPVPRIPSAD